MLCVVEGVTHAVVPGGKATVERDRCPTRRVALGRGGADAADTSGRCGDLKQVVELARCAHRPRLWPCSRAQCQRGRIEAGDAAAGSGVGRGHPEFASRRHDGPDVARRLTRRRIEGRPRALRPEPTVRLSVNADHLGRVPAIGLAEDPSANRDDASRLPLVEGSEVGRSGDRALRNSGRDECRPRISSAGLRLGNIADIHTLESDFVLACGVVPDVLMDRVVPAIAHVRRRPVARTTAVGPITPARHAIPIAAIHVAQIAEVVMEDIEDIATIVKENAPAIAGA